MAARIIDGKAVAARLREEVGRAAARFAEAAGRPAGLAVVLVGDDPASAVYVRSKERATEAAGMRGVAHRLPADTSQDALLALVDRLNADDQVDGILVQLPLPARLDAQAVVARIDPAKDVDGLTPVSAGRLALGLSGLVPCTPLGCVKLLNGAGVKLDGAAALVIGRSILVGKPVAQLLLARGATVTVAHSRTRDLEAEVARADVVVAAVGRPEMVRGEWLKPGAAVIDVGINRLADGRLVGDVHYASATERAGWITPVPGGVGPMTIACLLRNALAAACAREGLTLEAGL